MPTFCHNETGYAVDVWANNSLSDYLGRFPHMPKEWTVVQIPDGTLPGAKDNGNGNYTNPVVPLPVLTDQILSKDSLIEHFVTQFGTGPTGQQRWGAIILAARASNDAIVAYAVTKFDANTTFPKAQAVKFLQAVRAASLPAGAIVTPAEISNTSTNWPQG